MMSICHVKAAVYTNNNTSGAATWSSGTGWDAVPASNLDTILLFGSTTSPITLTGAVTSTNDIAGTGPNGGFFLNQLTFGVTGNSLVLAGNSLEFANDSSANTPVIDPGSSSSTTIEIRNNLILDGTLTIKPQGTSASFYLGGNYSVVGVNGTGVISGVGGLSYGASRNLLVTGLNTYGGGTAITGTGTITVLKSSTGSPGAVTAGAFGTGAVTVSGSAVIDLFSGQGDISLANDLAVNSSSLSFGAGGGSRGNLTWSGALTLGANTTINTALSTGKRLTISGAVGQTGGARTLTISNSNAAGLAETAIFKGNNTYTGTTTINTVTSTTGTLMVAFDGTNQSSTFNLNSSRATLAGSGTIGALNIQANGGTVAPGSLDLAGASTTGVLKAASLNASLAGANATFSFQLATTATSDRIDLSGTAGANISGANLNLLSAGFSGNDGNWFLLLNNQDTSAALRGTFASLAQGALITLDTTTLQLYYGANFDSSGNFVSASGGNDIALQVIPEPSAVVMAGLGLFFAGLRRMNRNRQAA